MSYLDDAWIDRLEDDIRDLEREIVEREAQIEKLQAECERYRKALEFIRKESIRSNQGWSPFIDEVLNDSGKDGV